VEPDAGNAKLRYLCDPGLRIVDHEVDLDPRLDGVRQGADEGQPEGQEWDEMAVADVHVDPVHPGVNQVAGVISKGERAQ
jgi:hypothetical protein